MTIRVLSEKHMPARAIAPQLGVVESTVRYHLQRAREGAVDGRAGKPRVASELSTAIEAWCFEHARDDRPINARDLHDWLVKAHGYRRSYKSVLRYVRDRFGRPKVRTYRRVETPPGAQAQTDWGEFPRIDLGQGPQHLHAFVMALSFSRRPAIVWSEHEDRPRGANSGAAGWARDEAAELPRHLHGLQADGAGTVDQGRDGPEGLDGEGRVRRQQQLVAGAQVGGRFHTQKGQEYSRALEKWLSRNPNASASDRSAAQALLNDLHSALGGR